MEKQPEKLISMTEAAKRCKTTTHFLKRMIMSGNIKAIYKPGSKAARIYLEESELFKVDELRTYFKLEKIYL